MPLTVTFEIKTDRTHPQLRSHLAKIKAHYTEVEFGMSEALTGFVFMVAKLDDIPALAAHMRLLGEGTVRINGQLNLSEVPGKQRRPRAGQSVQSLGLTATLVTRLAELGITTINALTAMSYTELIKLSYIGKGKAATIKEALEKHGHHLRED